MSFVAELSRHTPRGCIAVYRLIFLPRRERYWLALRLVLAEMPFVLLLLFTSCRRITYYRLITPRYASLLRIIVIILMATLHTPLRH